MAQQDDLSSFQDNPLYRNGRKPTPAEGGLDKWVGDKVTALSKSWANPNMDWMGNEKKSGKLLPSISQNPVEPYNYGNEGRVTAANISVPAPAAGLPARTEDYADFSMPDQPAPTQAAKAQPGADPWKAMAQQLSQYSQQRAGVSVPQQMGGFNELPDYAAAENDEKTRRWARDSIAGMSGISQRERARLMTQMLNNDENNQTARAGQRVTSRGQDLQAGVTSRGQDMSAMLAAQGHGVQSRGQDMQAMSAMFGHQATGLNQEAHDKRAREAGMDLETLKQADPKNQGLMEYYKQQGLESEAKANLYGIQAENLATEARYNKTPHAQALKEITAHQATLKDLSPDTPAYKVAAKRLEDLSAKLAYADHLEANAAKSEGGNGYADGGSVFADNSQAGLEKRLAAMQSMNAGASVSQAYGGVPKFGEWNFDDDRSVQQDLRSGTNGSYGVYSGPSTGYAQGGPIAVGGRPVLGAGDGKSDSLPAVIDGEHPAALSTGEFVMPIEAVQHFGLDRLNKMVAAARKGLDTGRGEGKMQQPANA